MTTSAASTTPLVTRILHLPITSDVEAFVTAARAAERAVVQLGSPGAEYRGQLERFVVRGIDAELERLGAAPPGWRYEDGLESIVSDQLYRARLLGHSGLAVRFDALSGLADGGGQLGAEDSGTLRRLVALAEREPVQLYLPRRCAELQIIGDPEPLAAWLPPSLEPGRVASIEYDGLASSPAAPMPADTDLSAATLLPPRIEAFFGGATTPLPPDVGDPTTPLPPDVGDPTTPLPPAVRGAAEAPLPSEANAAAEAPPPPDVGNTAEASLPSEANAAGEAPLPPKVRDTAAKQPSPSQAAEPRDLAAATPDPSARAPREPEPEPAAIDPRHDQRCIAWATQLASMNGPKVHGSVEKTFITTYLPLCREIAAGLAPAEAAAAAQKWAEGFAQGYASAFRQLGSSARRPLMVKDVVEVGVRWLGQHHARQCQLLLVSAMRFDLGQRLNEELERRLSHAATCDDQCVLWAALPSNAEAQQLGAPDAAPPGRRTSRPAADAARIESFCVGNRNLFKLDHVPDDLARAGEVEARRLERLAAELADAIVPFVREQPPETLVVVFGDHGFHWQASPRGTSAAQRGGALPEQVLVSASAWLVREPRQKVRMAPGVH